MNSWIKSLLASLLAVGLLAACNLPQAGPAPVLTGSATQPAPGAPSPSLDHDALDTYAADFQMQFTGASGWSYGTTTLKSPTLRETNLHLDGLPPAQNPGARISPRSFMSLSAARNGNPAEPTVRAPPYARGAP